MERKFTHHECVLYIADRFRKEFRESAEIMLQSSLEVFVKVFCVFYEDFLIEKGVARKEQFYEEPKNSQPPA